MPTRFETLPIPPSVAILPLLFLRRDQDRSSDLGVSLAAAAAADRACLDRRNSRARLAYLLCELAFQYGRRTGDYSCFPICRHDIAQALDIGLVRVKRILAWLVLSRVVETEGRTLTILDWQRLSALGGYDPDRLGEARVQDEEEASSTQAEPTTAGTTRTGEPACFV